MFSWPPPPEDDHDAPTASPLYVPPPETQHTKVATINPTSDDKVPAAWLAQQSRSAPELTTLNLKEHNEAESCSESYTSTCTTTTTTSEEYQRMYQANQSQYQAYDQSTSDIEYSADAELAAYPQQQCGSFSSGTTDLMSFSGRRSVQECAESLSHVVDTSQLVKYLKDLTPAAETPPPIKPIKHVEFAEPVYEAIRETPIHEIKPIPLSSIPNHSPKEWKSQMVRALTTASGEPYHISEVQQNEGLQQETVYQQKTYRPQQENQVAREQPIQPVRQAEQYEGCPEVCEEPCVRKQVCALTDQCKEVCSITQRKQADASFMHEEPPKGSNLSSLLTTASPYPVEWTKLDEPITITLPQETVPYFPPPISMKPYEKEDPYAKKTPLHEALVTAPFRSFTPFDHDVITQLEDLPTPKEELKLIDALTVASDDPYTELNKPLPPITPAEQIQLDENERLAKQAQEVQQIISHTIETQMDRQLSAFAKVSGFRSVHPFKPMPKAFPAAFQTSNIDTTTTTAQLQQQISEQLQNTTSSIVCQQQSELNACQASTQCHTTKQQQAISFPPPHGVQCKSYVQSGLHEPNTIPKYQRQWFNLASQSPVRTPEPQELKENVPLAFVELPHEDAQKPVAVTVSIIPATDNNDTSRASVTQQQNETFQSTESYRSQSVQSQSSAVKLSQRTASPGRPHTPSLINKPAPTIPYYQQNLVAEECQPSNSLLFDPRIASPHPDRCPSPAPGPPPNPLRIHAPRVKSPDTIEQYTPYDPNNQSHSSSYQSNTVSAISQPISLAGGGQVLSQYQSLSEAGERNYIDRPEVIQQKQIGNMNIQSRSKENELNEGKKSNFESASTTQIGNTQIQRKTRVVEEFEHTQKAKSIEIYKSSGQARSITASQGTGQQNFASYKNNQQISAVQTAAIQQQKSVQQNQAQQNFSCYKSSSNQTKPQQQVQPAKPIQSQPPQSTLGFVAREARRLSTNSQYTADLASYQSKFPEFTSPTPTTSFPIKNFHPISEEPKSQTYNVNKQTQPKQAGPPPGYQQISPASINKITQQQQQHSLITKQSQQTQLSSTSLTSSTTATAPKTANAIPSYPPQQSSYNLPAAIPVPAFKPPLSTANDFKPSQSGPNYKPTPSSGPGFKPPNTIPSAVVSDPTPASAGPNKGLTFGATSAPKRGRGILNNPGVGGRIPQCGCCSAQIR